MKMSLSIPQQVRPLLNIPYSSDNHHLRHGPPKDKVVVVMGATGAGKSRLSIDLAAHFSSAAAEIINSDKMQVYRGLDITTNKITDDESRGVPHHLLGIVDPESDFSAADFRARASISMRSIVGRNRLPIIVGGSNSFVEALVDSGFRSRFDCCFLWVDVAMPVLRSFVSDRVERMVDRGMIDEVRAFYDPNSADYCSNKGIRRAIGVPEFDEFFRAENFCCGGETRERLLAEAIEKVKKNTSRLACRQLEKIHRLRKIRGWRMHRVDATDVFRKQAAWESAVVAPSAAVVSRFLYGLEPAVSGGVRTMVAAATASY